MGIHGQIMRPAVFLDRDGVINRAFVRNGTPYPPDSVAALEILPGVPEALNALRSRGYSLVVVTNQPDVARGTLSRGVVDGIHARLQGEFHFDAILTCFHDDTDDCDCRKPQPGLLLRAARDLGIDLASSFMVGDRWRDVEAGQRAGSRTVFVDHDYAERRPASYDYRVGSLLEAANIIVSLPVAPPASRQDCEQDGR
jgi:D-glycero-D-manno-heptose 1,7-bisphosphate phosphatase